ncbi:tRNA uracil 4-sulfurtransferase ThiI [Treponema pedis]|uniref:Probable tRNA sulfurtransferase n=1 Tax=Treponema pedis TaxID=409322 RepID=A0A7S6WNW3_9SPIR|nr:tRNA uracil 4-sulfurtransferase ThiI [Treponema pedis]QOW60608.1 tRNA 4-thiouridine(8) synthase ThiI [Treponema pedis]QSI03878.1 tRNA 4-thiouridine(8) synthase ThiI [Treponema pedis]
MGEIFYLAKIGEINLKKGNLKDFELRLSQNLQKYLLGAAPKIRVRAGRMYVTVKEEFKEKTEDALNKLIGITGWAKAIPAEKNFDSIAAVAKTEAVKARERGCKTFKIESRRGEKTFPMTSYEISREVGGIIHTEGILQVDVHNPDVIISIEIREQAFIYGAEHKGRRGLPCGCSGRGLLLLSGGIDSPVAGFKMLSRGMKLDYIYFHSHPYTSPEAQEKVETLASILASYGLGGYLNTIPFTKVQQRIKEKTPEPYLTLIMRICMMKIANMTAKSINAKCLITGESLAQVASQTIENITVTNSFAEYPVFRPLIGTDKEDITIAAREIGTYETSILPYEDCCVMFSPKHPILHSRLEDARDIYARLEIDELLEEAYSQRTVKKFEF